MSKLLERAKICLKHAKHDYLYIGENDAYVDDCCFNIQQGIELSLKYLVELSGQRCSQTRDIRANLNLLCATDYDIPNAPELRMLAHTINEWKVKSCYLDSFTAMAEDITTAKGYLSDLIEYAEKLTIEMRLDPAALKSDIIISAETATEEQKNNGTI